MEHFSNVVESRSAEGSWKQRFSTTSSHLTLGSITGLFSHCFSGTGVSNVMLDVAGVSFGLL